MSEDAVAPEPTPMAPAPVTGTSAGGYPRWQGQLSAAPRAWSIIVQEVRRAYNDQWGRAALILAFGYGVIFIAQIAAQANSRPSLHSLATYYGMLDLLRWPALGMAAVMAGGALLDDDRKGALELYLSRSVTRWSYLVGKVLAVLGLVFVMMAGPALIYYLVAFGIFDVQPDGWAWAILGALGYSAIWAIVVTGLGLGVSCLVRSSRAASIILFAGVAGMYFVLGELLEAITRTDTLQVLNPLSMLDQQRTWLVPNGEPMYSFPWWWGVVGLAGLAIAGWVLVWLRHPRIKGVS